MKSILVEMRRNREEDKNALRRNREEDKNALLTEMRNIREEGKVERDKVIKGLKNVEALTNRVTKVEEAQEIQKKKP